MGNRRDLADWALVAAQGVFLVLAEHNYASLPAVASHEHDNAGKVSVIIPARNEEDRLPPLLSSLRSLRYYNVEVIVVDDSSTDGTARVAREEGCRVVQAGDLPPGWTGKCHACARGAEVAVGDWLLFTDADTIHLPGSLGSALSSANDHAADLVSLLARQECRTAWERLVLPYAYALYFAGAFRINRPLGPSVANGQYMLVRRSAYRAVGGHGAIRGSVVEDVALASELRSHGFRILLARGEDVLSVRMYDTLSLLWEGFSKNSFRFLLASPHTGLLTALTSIAIGSAAPSAIRAGTRSAALACAVVPAVGLLPWYRRFGVPLMYAGLFPVASALFGLIALDSIRRWAIPGATRWRGRQY